MQTGMWRNRLANLALAFCPTWLASAASAWPTPTTNRGLSQRTCNCSVRELVVERIGIHGRPYQRAEETTWTQPMPISRNGRHPAMGRIWSDRGQPDQYRNGLGPCLSADPAAPAGAQRVTRRKTSSHCRRKLRYAGMASSNRGILHRKVVMMPG
jgi:hypothetical protein